MNDLKIFENPEFGSIRTLEINGEPWFVGKDVAEILAYNEPHKAITRHVDEEDRTKHPILSNLSTKAACTVLSFQASSQQQRSLSVG